MIERRLVIDPQDILHVEIRCRCGIAHTVPTRDTIERHSDFRDPHGRRFNVFSECSCGQKFDDHALALVRALAGFTDPGNGVRLVVRDAQPTPTSSP